MSSALQSNTIRGQLAKIANGAITAGLCVKLHTATGKVTACTAANDRPQFVALNDAADGETVQVLPLEPGGQVRIKAGTVSGTQNAGVAVYLAASNDGKVNEVSTSATKIGYAEETFVTGQLVLIRPISPA